MAAVEARRRGEADDDLDLPSLTGTALGLSHRKPA